MIPTIHSIGQNEKIFPFVFFVKRAILKHKYVSSFETNLTFCSLYVFFKNNSLTHLLFLINQFCLFFFFPGEPDENEKKKKVLFFFC